MSECMRLIPGRTSEQGTALNAGKLKSKYREVTSTVEINADDMNRLGLKEGDNVRLRSAAGEVVVTCKGREATDLPSGLLFIAYGPASSQLMDGDTAGTGMPLSKDIEVEVEGPVAPEEKR
ncbi:MAG: molybdopterin dinucleotide binding domain-containing protein [Gammaproteobacteria bacterium]|nr:molybdopterin dinucleotide binding domain-containing protein [Gammaproteobacteria bacterium]